MNGNKLALDANIVLYLLSGNDKGLADFLEPQQGYLSVVTELELIG